MPLLKFGRPIDDLWVTLGDDDPLADAPMILSLARWQRDREALRGHNGPLGIRLEPGQSPALIADDLSRFGVVVLDFPVFKDGRPFSYARLLRDRHGFTGEVRAAGHVLRDQYQFLHRCGVDALEVPADKDGDAAAEDWRLARAEISHAYQPATDGAPWIARMRQRAQGTEAAE